jgi:hypothetical protein
MADPKAPPPAAGGPIGFLRAATYRLLRQNIMRQILPDPNDFHIERSVGAIKFRLHPRKIQERPRPFDVQVFDDDEGGFYATVSPGLVIERIPGGTENAVKLHEAENIAYGADVFPPNEKGQLKRFAVRGGQQVTLLVKVRPDGSVASVRVVIEAVSRSESVHWIPAIGDDLEGVAGEYHYNLAEIAAGESPGSVEVLPKMSGSHIDHWVELPNLTNSIEAATENVGRIVARYDQRTNSFVHRAIRNKHPKIKVTETHDAIEIEEPYGVEGKNLNLTINYLFIDNGGDIYDLGTSPTTLYFRNGGYVGNSDPDNGQPPAQLDLQNATYLSTAP